MKAISILPLTAAIVLLIAGCAEEPKSQSVTMTVYDASGTAPFMKANPLEGVTVDAQTLSNDEQPKDATRNATSDADGVVSLRLGETEHKVGFSKTGHISANVYIKVTANGLDTTSFPIVLPPGEGNNNECRDVMNVTETTSGTTSGSWLRVYIDGTGFTEDDTLTVTPVGHNNTVADGADLLDATTSAPSGNQSNYFYFDIYDDSSKSADSTGHKDTQILGGTTSGTDLRYTVTLNGQSRNIIVDPCSRGGYAAVYFKR